MTNQNDAVQKSPIRPDKLLEYISSSYSPSPDEIRDALKHAGLTGSNAGDLLGVSGRTVRKWTGGDQKMPHSAWLTLLVYAYDAEVPHSNSGDLLAVQRMVATLIRDRIMSIDELGYWEKDCLLGAIAALEIGMIRLSMVDLAKADVPSDERNENYVPKNQEVDQCTREQMIAALSKYSTAKVFF
jgi:DNA-binding transcriptional regulator YiaG